MRQSVTTVEVALSDDDAKLDDDTAKDNGQANPVSDDETEAVRSRSERDVELEQPGTDETAADVLVIIDESVEADADDVLIGVDKFIIAAGVLLESAFDSNNGPLD